MNLRSIALLAAFAPIAVFAETGDYAANEILVKYKAGGVSAVTKIAAGGKTVSTIKEINVERIKLSGMTPQQAINVFKSDSNVVYAEVNHRKKLFFVPNDPKLGQQYGIDQVRAKQAWDITKGNANTLVCVIDTGVRLDHEEFAGRIAPGCYDWSDNDGDVSDDTGSGHGTHTSGIAVAGTNNSKGIASVCYNGKLLHMKIFPNSFDSVSASAIIDAANKGARVISMSYGSSSPSQVEQDAVTYAWNKGVILFASAGNNGDTAKNYPAALDNVIAVAATNNQDVRAGFSTYGDWVPIAAPGENIISSFFTGPSDYVFESGTSMACPFAASVAGLMIGRNPAITNTEVKNIIFNTCDNVGTFITKGRVNAFKAVQQVVQPLPFTGTPVSAQVAVVGGSSEGTQIGSYGSPAIAGQTIKLVDGSTFGISSLNKNKIGNVASLDTFVKVSPQISDLLSANIVFTGRSAAGSSCLFFLYNFSTGAWDQFGSTSMTTSNKSVTLTISMASVANYVNGSNMIRIMARNIVPARVGNSPTYFFVTDQLNITGTSKPAI